MYADGPLYEITRGWSHSTKKSTITTDSEENLVYRVCKVRRKKLLPFCVQTFHTNHRTLRPPSSKARKGLRDSRERLVFCTRNSSLVTTFVRVGLLVDTHLESAPQPCVLNPRALTTLRYGMECSGRSVEREPSQNPSSG